MKKPEKNNNETFSTLIESEQAIERQLEAERLRAGRWLESEKAEMARTLALELNCIEESRQQRLAAGINEAREKVEKLVHEANEMARRSAGIERTSLAPVIRQHLTAIDPRTQYDRPDVQN
ncbi:hypothetical protein [Trichloromonas sp.]|uniref:hypothetical protein n=1 Tax=Trichloromonas sp. TaxID=3069249 RepID=UPI003D813B7F